MRRSWPIRQFEVDREFRQMIRERRGRRMLRLRHQIRQADILAWRDRFFEALEKTGVAATTA